jgi:Xaa-Pro aminopeptidase
MKERGLDAVLIFATFQGWQNVFYFSNHWDLVSAFLLVPAASDPVLITGVYPHLSAVRDVSRVRDVRFGGGGSIELIGSILDDRSISRGKLGIVEPDSFRIPGIPHREMSALRQRLPDAEMVFCTEMVEAMRRNKSDEEIEVIRECAGLSDRCLERVIDILRPGMSELDVAHEIEAAPGATVAVLVGSTSMQNPSVPAPSIRPTGRVIGEGDVVLIELSKGFAGYAGQVHGMITLGGATDDYLQMHAIARNAYRSIAAVLRAGCRPRQVAEAASMIANAGFTVANPLVHGFGMGIESGLHVGMPGQGPYWPPGDFVFSARSTVTIEPNPCDQNWKKGATAGGLVLVTETGCQHLQRYADHELIQKRL